jgi:hypothetical protein
MLFPIANFLNSEISDLRFQLDLPWSSCGSLRAGTTNRHSAIASRQLPIIRLPRKQQPGLQVCLAADSPV